MPSFLNGADKIFTTGQGHYVILLVATPKPGAGEASGHSGLLFCYYLFFFLLPRMLRVILSTNSNQDFYIHV